MSESDDVATGPLLTSGQVAKILGYRDRSSVYRIPADELPFIQRAPRDLGGGRQSRPRRLYRRADVEAYANRGQRSKRPSQSLEDRVAALEARFDEHEKSPHPRRRS
jgi:hypothetical protein